MYMAGNTNTQPLFCELAAELNFTFSKYYKWVGLLQCPSYLFNNVILFESLKDTIQKISSRRKFKRLLSEAVAQSCSVKKVFLEISQNSQDNACARLRPATLLKKTLWHRCFPVNFAKFLRTPFLKEHLRWLLLYYVKKIRILIKPKVIAKKSTHLSRETIKWTFYHAFSSSLNNIISHYL